MPVPVPVLVQLSPQVQAGMDPALAVARPLRLLGLCFVWTLSRDAEQCSSHVLARFRWLGTLTACERCTIALACMFSSATSYSTHLLHRARYATTLKSDFRSVRVNHQ